MYSKAGLAVLAVEGLYLWAFKKDDKDDSASAPDLIAPAAPTATLADDTVTVTGKTEQMQKSTLNAQAIQSHRVLQMQVVTTRLN